MGVFYALVILLNSGCAGTQQSRQLLSQPRGLPASVELATIPFFPQQTDHCGPAALATVLTGSRTDVTPETLAPEVFLPQRQGSLQVELLAAARRHGRIPYVIQPRLDDLLREVAAGNPVLVLQNLGLNWLPRWHYAVVVGFDLQQQQVILRSGAIKRHITRLTVFEHTWRRGGYWAVVVTPPDRLPETVQELPYLQAVVALERLRQWQVAVSAYGAALQRWPHSLGGLMGLGNSRHALRDLRGAEYSFRRATVLHPEAAPAFNNLAQTLAEQGRWREAEMAAARAVTLGGPELETYETTLAQIRTRAFDVPVK